VRQKRRQHILMTKMRYARKRSALATELLPMAMTGHPRQEGEDVMRLTCHAVPKPSEDLLQHTADAQKGGVRLWLLGSNVE
jgi:hypothetical protein